MLMKEVDTFFVVFFFAVCFLPKMVYHRAFSFFLYRSVLCICIYKQIYTNNICRLQSAFSVKGFIAPLPLLSPLNSKQSLYKQSDYTVKKKKKEKKK